jgi:hypothetical protein
MAFDADGPPCVQAEKAKLAAMAASKKELAAKLAATAKKSGTFQVDAVSHRFRSRIQKTRRLENAGFVHECKNRHRLEKNGLCWFAPCRSDPRSFVSKCRRCTLP